MDNKDITSGNAKETKSIMVDYYMFVQGFEMTWAIVSGLMPRLGINDVNYHPSTLIKNINGQDWRIV